MTAERSGGNELAQLMTNHVFCHIDGNVLAAVMDSDRMTDKGGEDGREDLDQVFSTFFSPVLFSSSRACTAQEQQTGPFLMLLLMFQFLPYLLLRRLMMNRSVRFFVLRVL